MSDVLEKIDLEENEVISREIFPYDPAEDLISDEGIAYFMTEAFETGDAAYIEHALGVAARAKGMIQIVKETGISREQLFFSYRGKGEATFKDTLTTMQALGINLTTKVAEKQHGAAA